MPVPSESSREEAASGESYGAILLDAGATTGAGVLETLRGARFTGWIAPPNGDWLVILGHPGDGVVASGRRGIIEVAALLAQAHERALVIRVVRDRQLAIVAWRDGEEVGRYCSDPSQGPPVDDEILSDPIGAEDAEEFAQLVDRDVDVEKLTELLADELDTESVFESERLIGVLRMLDLPSWVVAAAALPRDIPTGPRAAELARLRAGASGFVGILRNVVVRRARRRRTPPPVIADPPRSNMSGFESWML